MTLRSFRNGTRVYWLDAPAGDWCSLAKGKIRSGVVARRELGAGQLRDGPRKVAGYQVRTSGRTIYKSARKLATATGGLRRFIASAKRACAAR